MTYGEVFGAHVEGCVSTNDGGSKGDSTVVAQAITGRAYLANVVLVKMCVCVCVCVCVCMCACMHPEKQVPHSLFCCKYKCSHTYLENGLGLKRCPLDSQLNDLLASSGKVADSFLHRRNS